MGWRRCGSLMEEVLAGKVTEVGTQNSPANEDGKERNENLPDVKMFMRAFQTEGGLQHLSRAAEVAEKCQCPASFKDLTYPKVCA